jgi:3-isopropylmalate dehydratase small subunit
MNTYNIFNENEPATILFHAIAESENQVKELAKENSIDLSNLTIELERKNVKNQMGKPFAASIQDAIVH